MKREIEDNRDKIIQQFLLGKEGDTQTVETTKKRLDDSYLDDFSPLEVQVYGNNFDRAFKTFRAMVQKDRILSLYKQKQSHEKPSVKKRRKRNEMAQKRQELEAKRQRMLSGEFDKEMQKKQRAKEVRQQAKAEKHNKGQ